MYGQDRYEQQYQNALVNTKRKIEEVEGPDIKENMSDKIREWFIQCRDQVFTSSCALCRC